jgi:serine/threonine protein kinase
LEESGGNNLELVLQTCYTEDAISEVSLIDSNRAKNCVVKITEVIKGTDSDGNKVINEYAVLTELGKGSYGKVKLAVNTKTNTLCAIKIINRARLLKNEQGHDQHQA